MADALRPVTTHWLEKLRLAWDHKKCEFQDSADECARFFDGPYDWLYSPVKGTSSSFGYGGTEDLPGPSARMTVNKTAELVQLFGPALYHRNPVRKVNPRHVPEPPTGLYGDPNDPMVQMMLQQDMMQVQGQWEQDNTRAHLLEKYLNYTPTAMDLKTESRWAITEVFVKGMGCLWTRLHKSPGGVMSWSGSFFDSVDNLYLDPDADSIRDIKWMARRRVRPVWEVEREFPGLAPGMLKSYAGLESNSAQAGAATDPTGDYRRKQGRTTDLVVYWEIYSKMGLGGRLSGVAQGLAQSLDQAGDHVFLAICEGCPYPLNLPPPFCDAAADAQMYPELQSEVQQRVAWPTPYWADGTWPMTPVVFHWRPKKLWPMSHMKPGMGELMFLNWAWSFLAQKVRVASRDFIAIAKSAGEDIKNRIKHGGDFTVIEVEQVLGSIDQVVKFLQHPGFNPEIYTVIEGVTQNFERRVGLTELMYGLSSRQMRSAEEASLRSDAVNVRPDDMGNQVEDAMTEVARKEAFCARWHLRGQDVQQVLGPVGARDWEALVVPSDPAAVLYALEYRIEANSARKPNQALQQENMRQAVQQLFNPLWQYAQATGNVTPINALISDWAKSVDLDATPYLLQAPPPLPAPAEGTGAPAAATGPPQAA